MRGFTLIEILVVLLIAGLLLAVAPAYMPSVLPGAELKSGARELAAALRQARSRAVVQGGEAVLVLDLAERRYWLEAEAARALPQRAELTLFTARSERLDEARGAIRFFADGSSTGGRVELRGGERRYRIDVDWLTGRVTTSEPLG